MKNYKSGFVTIIGRPNVGKSTLLNKVLGQKIVITSDKAQTTRRRIKGIYTDNNAQIVFIDTPGVHKPLNRFGEAILEESKLAIPDTDLILFLVDLSTSAGAGDKWIVKNLLGVKTPIILVLNKADLIKNPLTKEENLLSYKLLFSENLPTVKISAQTGRNIDNLISNIVRKLPVGEKIYDEDVLTDESVRNIAKEIVREKILQNTKEEIPHSIAVVIEKYEEKKDIDVIYATIIVEQDSQKAILIGKNAQMLKNIGTLARKDIEKVADKKIYLDLKVKLQKDWRKKSKNLEQYL